MIYYKNKMDSSDLISSQEKKSFLLKRNDDKRKNTFLSTSFLEYQAIYLFK
jgi:hypothetical protein